MTVFEKTTHGITVLVEPEFLEEESSPEDSHYVWTYHVTIRNNTNRPVRLQSRYWRITDATGAVHEVSGEGVVGEKPLLGPGAQYEYSSGAPLRTATGFMGGSYEMYDDNDRKMTVDIPLFSLDSPYQKSVLH